MQNDIATVIFAHKMTSPSSFFDSICALNDLCSQGGEAFGEIFIGGFNDNAGDIQSKHLSDVHIVDYHPVGAVRTSAARIGYAVCTRPIGIGVLTVKDNP